jgi:hypothetical protein
MRAKSKYPGFGGSVALPVDRFIIIPFPHTVGRLIYHATPQTTKHNIVTNGQVLQEGSRYYNSIERVNRFFDRNMLRKPLDYGNYSFLRTFRESKVKPRHRLP